MYRSYFIHSSGYCTYTYVNYVYGVRILDALTLLICASSVGVTCARQDMCRIAVVYITGSVHNRMIVVNGSGAAEFLVYELARNTYGVRQVQDATKSSWTVRRITSVC